VRRARRWSLTGVLALGLLLSPTLVLAQGVTVAAGAFNARRGIYYQGAVHEQTGLVVGGSGTLRLGRFRIGAGGWMGTLKGDGNPTNPDVKARTTSATVQVLVAPGVLVGARYEVRRFEADVAVTVWTLMGANVRMEPGLGFPGLSGLIDASVLPSSSVSGGPKLTMALQATVGVVYAPPRSPFVLRLGYRVERFDIKAAGISSARFEQFQGLVVEAGLSLGR
jgi:hypothetical protein